MILAMTAMALPVCLIQYCPALSRFGHVQRIYCRHGGWNRFWSPYSRASFLLCLPPIFLKTRESTAHNDICDPTSPCSRPYGSNTFHPCARAHSDAYHVLSSSGTCHGAISSIFCPASSAIHWSYLRATAEDGIRCLTCSLATAFNPKVPPGLYHFEAARLYVDSGGVEVCHGYNTFNACRRWR